MKHIPASDESFRCPECGADSSTFAAFCLVCGTKIATHERHDSSLLAHGDVSDLSRGANRSEALRAPQWETVVGLSLVALVLAYALFTWIQSTNRSNSYYEGLAAIERKDWDVAAARLVEASDHPNAQSRLNEVNKAREERDRLYAEGVEAAGRGRWNDARSALRRVREIQPAYKDSTQLLAQAEANWQRQSLAGIVYLVAGGDVDGCRGTSAARDVGCREGGLYLRDFTGETVKLPGSDAQSVVRAISADGLEVAYDRPSHENLLSTPVSGSDPVNTDTSERTVVLASLGRDGSAGVLMTIPIPTLHPEGTGVFSQYGLWWYSPRGRSTFDGYELFYARPYYLAPTATVRVSTSGEGARIAALDPPRSRIVIAESIGESRSSAKRNRLFIAGPAGEDPQLLHDLAGDVYQASFSPDGQWLLYVAQENGARITRTVWALPLLEGGRGRPRQLSRISWSGIEMDVGLSASFLPVNGRQQVVVSRADGKTEQLTIYALELKRNERGVVWQAVTSVGANTHTISTTLGRSNRLDAGAFAHDGSYIVSTRRQNGEIWAPEGAAALELGDRRDGSLTWTRRPLTVFDQQTVRITFAPRDDYLAVVVRNHDGINRGSTEGVHIVPVDDGHLGEPRYAGGASIPYSRVMPTIALPPDGSVLAYVNAARELKAISFDDMEETHLAHNVKAVWSLRSDPALTWWR
jgi:hypothetical protein